MKQLFVMVLLTFPAFAMATQPNQAPVTLPDGVVIKSDLPGTLMGDPNSDKPGNNKKVYVCHATSAVHKNGYVMIHVGKSAGQAHLNHEHATANGNGQENAERDLVGLDPSFEDCNPGNDGGSGS